MPATARVFIFTDRFDDTAVPKAAPPAPPPPSSPPPPPLTEDDIAEARAQAFAEGHRAALAEAASSHEAATARALAAIAERLHDAEAVVARLAEEHAHALAQLVMDALAVAYPTLAARHGETELHAFVTRVVEPMAQVPDVTLRVHPTLAQAVSDTLATLALRHAPQVIADAAMPEGDARIDWPDGHAVRAAANAWDGIAAILQPLGLLPEPPAPLAHEQEG